MRLLPDESSQWGRCPHTPGIYRIFARMTGRGGRSLGLRSFRLLSRRSGCVPAVPYPPLRSPQSGLLQPRRAMIYQPTAITPLTSCLTPGVQFTPAHWRVKPGVGVWTECERGSEYTADFWERKIGTFAKARLVEWGETGLYGLTCYLWIGTGGCGNAGELVETPAFRVVAP
jgi:hypothetical protein